MLELLLTAITAVNTLMSPPPPVDGWKVVMSAEGYVAPAPIPEPEPEPEPEPHHHHPVESSQPAYRATWDLIAQCESHGDWHINTGNGYYGGLQFSLRSWQWVGGSGYPHEASKSEQIARAEKLLSLQGWGAWPACSKKLGLR